MLPFRAWCCPAQTYKHLSCFTSIVQCSTPESAAGCVRAQHALGSGVPRRSKGKGQRRSGVVWKVRGRVSPLGCSPPMLDAALLARTSTSSALSFHMDCAMQLSAFAGWYVRTQHALGSGVPRCSMHGCAHTVHAHVRTWQAHIIHAWFCTNLDLYHLQSSSLVVLQKCQGASESKDDAQPGGGPLQRFMFTGQSIYCWAITSSNIKD